MTDRAELTKRVEELPELAEDFRRAWSYGNPVDMKKAGDAIQRTLEEATKAMKDDLWKSGLFHGPDSHVADHDPNSNGE